MNAAAVAKNVTIQYCSASAIDAMQSLRFDAVTNIRAFTDYACFVNYRVGPGYLISWALGLRPSKDVLWTTEVQPTKTKPPGAGCGGNIKGCSSCGGNFTWAQHYTYVGIWHGPSLVSCRIMALHASVKLGLSTAPARCISTACSGPPSPVGAPHA